eukprot:scaffold4.g4848.t1
MNFLSAWRQEIAGILKSSASTVQQWRRKRKMEEDNGADVRPTPQRLFSPQRRRTEVPADMAGPSSRPAHHEQWRQQQQQQQQEQQRQRQQEWQQQRQGGRLPGLPDSTHLTTTIHQQRPGGTAGAGPQGPAAAEEVQAQPPHHQPAGQPQQALRSAPAAGLLAMQPSWGAPNLLDQRPFAFRQFRPPGSARHGRAGGAPGRPAAALSSLQRHRSVLPGAVAAAFRGGGDVDLDERDQLRKQVGLALAHEQEDVAAHQHGPVEVVDLATSDSGAVAGAAAGGPPAATSRPAAADWSRRATAVVAAAAPTPAAGRLPAWAVVADLSAEEPFPGTGPRRPPAAAAARRVAAPAPSPVFEALRQLALETPRPGAVSDAEYAALAAAAAAAAEAALHLDLRGTELAGTAHTQMERGRAFSLAEHKEWERKQIERQLEQLALQRTALKRQQEAAEAAAPRTRPAAPEAEEESDVVLLETSVSAVSEDAAASSEISQQLAAASIGEEVAPPLKVLELAELPPYWHERYADAISKRGGRRLGRQCGRLCRAAVELAAEVINLYMGLLVERDARRREEGAGGPRCHFFSSFFCNALYKDAKVYDYSRVRRWTLPKRLAAAGQASESVLDCDLIVLPVNQGNSHWTCAVVDLAQRRLVYYDSLLGEDHACLAHLARWLADEFQSKHGQQRADVLDWPREFPKAIPQQLNGCDCGVFTMLFASHLGAGAPLAFSQASAARADIQAFRTGRGLEGLQSQPHLPATINRILAKARLAWLEPEELHELLLFIEEHPTDVAALAAPAECPPGGSLLLYDRCACRYYRLDGHAWKLKPTNRQVSESNEELTVAKKPVLRACYAASRVDDLKARERGGAANPSGRRGRAAPRRLRARKGGKMESEGPPASDEEVEALLAQLLGAAPAGAAGGGRARAPRAASPAAHAALPPPTQQPKQRRKRAESTLAHAQQQQREAGGSPAAAPQLEVTPAGGRPAACAAPPPSPQQPACAAGAPLAVQRVGSAMQPEPSPMLTEPSPPLTMAEQSLAWALEMAGAEGETSRLLRLLASVLWAPSAGEPAAARPPSPPRGAAPAPATPTHAGVQAADGGLPPPACGLWRSRSKRQRTLGDRPLAQSVTTTATMSGHGGPTPVPDLYADVRLDEALAWCAWRERAVVDMELMWKDPASQARQP